MDAGIRGSTGGLAVALSVLVASAPCFAQSAANTNTNTTASEPTPPAAYDRFIDAALTEFDAGHWAEARALFVQAHASFPNARTLRGIGMASYEMRDYAEAVRTLENSLRERRRALTDEQRAQVTGLLDTARTFVGRFTVREAPPGSRLYVDGTQTDLPGWPAAAGHLVLGIRDEAYPVRIVDPAGRVASARVTVRGREERALDIDLSPLVTPAVAPPVADPPAVTEPPAVTHPWNPPEAPRRSSAPWVVLGVGGGAAVIGIALLAVYGAEANDVTHAVVDTAYAGHVAFAHDSGPAFSGAGGALLGLGLATALVGVIWAASAPSAPQSSARLRLGPLGVEGTF